MLVLAETAYKENSLIVKAIEDALHMMTADEHGCHSDRCPPSITEKVCPYRCPSRIDSLKAELDESMCLLHRRLYVMWKYDLITDNEFKTAINDKIQEAFDKEQNK